MELSQLKYFIAVANCGHVGHAAEMLHVSQSAVSMAISRLEKELNVELFEKNGRSIRLTSNGAVFLEMVAPAVAELDFAQKQIQLISRKEPDTLLITTEMPDFTISLERIYLSYNPSIRFRQGLDVTQTVLEKILCERVDFAITYEPIESPNVTNIHMLTEPVYVQLREDHPLARRESIYLKELEGTPMVSFSPEYSFRRWSDGLCFMGGINPNVFYEVIDTQSLMTMIRYNGCVAFIPKSSLYMTRHDEYPDNMEMSGKERVFAIPLADSFATRNVFLAYHKNRMLSSDARGFLDYALALKAGLDLFGDIRKAENWLKNHYHYSNGKGAVSKRDSPQINTK